MGDIVNLMKYKESKEYEKSRIKNLFAINARMSNLDYIINGINKCDGVSLLLNTFGYKGNNDSKELGLDSAITDVISEALISYKNSLQGIAAKLERQNEI